MQTETIIQSVVLLIEEGYVVEIGEETCGRIVIDIVRDGDTFTAYDENDEPICSIENTRNTPIMVEYQTIAVDGPAEK